MAGSAPYKPGFPSQMADVITRYILKELLDKLEELLGLTGTRRASTGRPGAAVTRRLLRLCVRC